MSEVSEALFRAERGSYDVPTAADADLAVIARAIAKQVHEGTPDAALAFHLRLLLAASHYGEEPAAWWEARGKEEG